MNRNPLQLPYSILLGSQSPRRQQLLKGLDLEFTVKVKPTDEEFDPQMKFEKVPVFLAEKKAEAFAEEIQGDKNLLVITADTIVAIDQHILNKPSDKADAIRMLEILSGRKHTVVTGVSITTQQKQVSFSSSTDVYFKTLSNEEINYYLDKYQPYDKAGSYGVQEWIGYACIEKMVGSYFNVMGLPVHDLYAQLQRF